LVVWEDRERPDGDVGGTCRDLEEKDGVEGGNNTSIASPSTAAKYRCTKALVFFFVFIIPPPAALAPPRRLLPGYWFTALLLPPLSPSPPFAKSIKPILRPPFVWVNNQCYLGSKMIKPFFTPKETTPMIRSLIP
jgi:hypothetical protein